MNTLLDRILEATRVGETTDWEFKSARGGFPGSFWESYSAMANSEGGVIVLGVREKDGQAHLDGLTPEQGAIYQKSFWDNLHNRNTVNTNHLSTQDVTTVEIDGLVLLAVHVPRATRTQRPIYLGHNPFGHTFRRCHEGDYRLDDAEVRRLLADAEPVLPDHRILEGFGLNDLDAASIAQYRQRLASLKGDHPWLSIPDREFLGKIGAWRQERNSDRQGVTLAGLLMFGKEDTIRDPDGVPGYFVDYREKLDPTLRWTDRVCPDGTWEPNLFQFYQRVWPKLSSGLPTPFRLEGSERRDETPAHEALREAFINALIHADFLGVGGIVIERYPDRFVLENSGTLLISLEQYHRGGVSECRNKLLQKMFALIGRGEQAGSGVDKIRDGWRHHRWRAPRLECHDRPSRIELVLPMVSLIPEDTLTHLRDLLGVSIDSLTPSELQALATAVLEDSVSNIRLQELLSDHTIEITRMLARLCERGLLVSDNRRRWATYRLAGPEKTPSLFDQVETIDEKVNSIRLDRDSIRLGQDSIRLDRDSIRLNEENEALRLLAAPIAEKGKVRPDEMKSVLQKICIDRYLSVEQLARLLHRNPVRLRSVFLGPMVQSGLLQLRYPDAPNRPDQAYTAVTALNDGNEG